MTRTPPTAPPFDSAHARQTPTHPPRILVIDDQDVILSLLEEVLTSNQYEVQLARDLNEARYWIQTDPFDALIVDIYLGPNQSGLDLLPALRQRQPHTPAIVISGQARMNDVVVALKAGAYDLITKPFNIIDVLHSVGRAVEKKQMAGENQRLLQELRNERDRLEERVNEATSDLKDKVETLRLLNEQVATMLEMGQANLQDLSSEAVLQRIFELLGRLIVFQGAFCVVYDTKVGDVTLSYHNSEAVRPFCQNMTHVFREHIQPLVQLVEASDRLPIQPFKHQLQACYPDGQIPERLMLMPLHVPQTLLGVTGLLRPERPAAPLSHGEERMLGLAISHFLGALEQRNFIARTGQLAGLGELISEIAHDLRHPLTSLRGASRILRSRWDHAGKRERCLEEIQGNLSRMESLVSELVNFYNPREMNMVPLDLHELLEKALQVTEPLIRQKNIQVLRHFDGSCPLMILGLSRNLMEAFINLITNACHAMDKPQSRLTVSTCTELTREDRHYLKGTGRAPAFYVRASIADNGVGISEENREKIFRRFFTTRPEGHGLGLSAVTRIVKKNLGHVHMSTEPGKGTTFNIYLPKA